MNRIFEIEYYGDTQNPDYIYIQVDDGIDIDYGKSGQVTHITELGAGHFEDIEPDFIVRKEV